jgi:S-adenosylmethionine/arginine decarboxylase-like enzyme
VLFPMAIAHLSSKSGVMNLTACYPISSPADDESLIRDYAIRRAWGIWTGIDLTDCNPLLIRSEDQLRAFVTGLCDYIEMKRYGEPTILRFGDEPRVTGYSLSQLIETSLVSGHFVEQDNTAYIDVFSCKQYYPYKTALYCRDFFRASSFNVCAALRGTGAAVSSPEVSIASWK